MVTKIKRTLCRKCRRAEYSDGVCPIKTECLDNPKLNLGSGISPKEKYINFDAHIYSGIQGWDKHLQTDMTGMIEDIITIFPPDFFAETLSSHVIEHFFFEDALTFLKNQMVLLRPGGKIVVEGPCILGSYRWYREDKDGPKDTIGIRALIETLYPYHIRLEFGPLMAHKSGWTGKVLAEEMIKLGFIIIHIGEGQLQGRGWHDFRVEGLKP